MDFQYLMEFLLLQCKYHWNLTLTVHLPSLKNIPLEAASPVNHLTWGGALSAKSKCLNYPSLGGKKGRAGFWLVVMFVEFWFFLFMPWLIEQKMVATKRSGSDQSSNIFNKKSLFFLVIFFSSCNTRIAEWQNTLIVNQHWSVLKLVLNFVFLFRDILSSIW